MKLTSVKTTECLAAVGGSLWFICRRSCHISVALMIPTRHWKPETRPVTPSTPHPPASPVTITQPATSYEANPVTLGLVTFAARRRRRCSIGGDTVSDDRRSRVSHCLRGHRLGPEHRLGLPLTFSWWRRKDIKCSFKKELSDDKT